MAILQKVRGYPGHDEESASLVRLWSSVVLPAVSEEVLPFPRTIEFRWILGWVTPWVGRKARVQGSLIGVSQTWVLRQEPTIVGRENVASVHEPQFLPCKVDIGGAYLSWQCNYSIS